MPTYTVYDYTTAGRLIGNKTYKDMSITVVRKLLLKSLKKNHQYEVCTPTSHRSFKWFGTLTDEGLWVTEDDEWGRSVNPDGTLH